MSTVTLYSLPSLLEAVINGENNETMRDSAKKLLDSYQKQTERRKSKAAEKKSIEDAPIIEAVTILLGDHTVRTASQIRDAVESIDSTSKATAICKRISGIKVSDVVVGKRIVKGYSL